MNILPNGYAVSETGLKALDDFLYDKDAWILQQLKSEIGNAKETMINTWLPRLMEDSEIQNFPKDQDAQIMLISSRLYYEINPMTPREIIPEKESPLNHILFSHGYDLTQAEMLAMESVWTSPSLWLQFRISDMVAHAKKEFRTNWNYKVLEDSSIQFIPKTDEDYVLTVTSKIYYKNKRQKQDEQGVQ